MNRPTILAQVKISLGVQAVLNTATIAINAPVETYRFVDAFMCEPHSDRVWGGT